MARTRRARGTTSRDRQALCQWIALLDNVVRSNINEPEAVVAQIRAALIRRVGDEGGPLIRGSSRAAGSSPPTSDAPGTFGRWLLVATY